MSIPPLDIPAGIIGADLLSARSMTRTHCCCPRSPGHRNGHPNGRRSEETLRVMSALGQKQTFAPQKGVSALPPKADMTARTYDVHPNSESGHALVFMSVSHPAPHPLNIVFISCSELTAHLGFLEGDVDPISGGEDGDRRNEHWPSADP